jgi:hypothetical protein
MQGTRFELGFAGKKYFFSSVDFKIQNYAKNILGFGKEYL